MYAIVKSGGKQYHVEPGQRLLVERLAAAVGETVTLEPLLYRSDEVLLDREALERVTVSATVLSHERGEKLRVFKFKPKRGYRRRTGHRQELSRIEVREITTRTARARTAAKETAPAREAAAPAAAKAPTRAARGPRRAPADKAQGAGAPRRRARKEVDEDGS
jgi:large subunit ribosomal protein L21